MTDEEARKVFDAISGADGGCTVCVRSIVEELEGTLPNILWGALYHYWNENSWKEGYDLSKVELHNDQK